ncbi:MAG: hypothetical protein ACFFG0_05485 [Candidatus Thorarchaeota archaeon]
MIKIPSHFIYKAYCEPKYGNTSKGICCFCGDSSLPCLPKNKYIGSNFTNIDYLKNPTLNHICVACAFSLQREFTRTSFICTESEFIALNRDKLTDTIFNLSVSIPFICCITTNYKKHMAFKTKTNNNIDRFYIQFDEIGVILEPKKHKPYFIAIEKLYNLLHSCGVKAKGLKYKDRIKNGEYDLRQIRSIGIKEFYSYENKIKEIRPSVLLNLLCWCANTHEEKKEVQKECLQKSKQKNIEPQQLSLL